MAKKINNRKIKKDNKIKKNEGNLSERSVFDEDYEEENPLNLSEGAKRFFTLLWGGYLIFLLGISLTPGSLISPSLTPLGGLFHYFSYFFLFILTLLYLLTRGLKGIIQKSICFGIFIAAFTEVAQIFIPGRYGSITDFCINLCGLFTIPIVLLIFYESMVEKGVWEL